MGTTGVLGVGKVGAAVARRLARAGDETAALPPHAGSGR